MSRPHLLLAHGWAFGPDVWEPMEKSLRRLLPDIRVTACNLGYDGTETMPLPDRNDGPVVAVGHSLGFLRLLLTPGLEADAWISVSGFSRFSRSEDFPAGVEPRLLRAMRGRVKRDKAGTIADFLDLCGLPAVLRPDAASFAPDKLAEGLCQLMNLDGRDRLASLAGRIPVLALAARDDAVAPPALTRACFADRPGVSLRTLPSGGHVLPLTRPGETAAAIADFLAGAAGVLA